MLLIPNRNATSRPLFHTKLSIIGRLEIISYQLLFVIKINLNAARADFIAFISFQ